MGQPYATDILTISFIALYFYFIFFQIQDTNFDGVHVRLYEPANRKKNELLPGFVYYHGGGWVLGSIGTCAISQLQLDAGQHR